LNPIEPVIEGSTQNVPPVVKNGTVLAASAVRS
jgi:hypothetical protein